MQYGKGRVQPGLLYFQSKFLNELPNSLAAFKAVCLYVTLKIHKMKPNVDLLKSFLFLSDQVLENLKLELPNRLAKVTDTSSDVKIIDWWLQHKDELPHWSSAAQKIALVQPSSAIVERIFQC